MLLLAGFPGRAWIGEVYGWCAFGTVRDRVTRVPGVKQPWRATRSFQVGPKSRFDGDGRRQTPNARPWTPNAHARHLRPCGRHVLLIHPVQHAAAVGQHERAALVIHH